MPCDTRGRQAVVLVDWALCLWHAGCVFMENCGKLWEIVGDCEILCFLKTSHNLSKSLKTSHNTYLHPPGLRAASVNIRKHP